MSTEIESPWPDNAIDATRAAAERDPLRGGEVYAELHRAERLFLDRLSGAAFVDDLELAKRITAQLDEFSELLSEHQVIEHYRWDGFRPDLPGRGHPLLPPYYVVAEKDGTITATVTFTRFYLGGNWAAHGGSQPLVIDDLLGRLVNHGRPGIARTAYLKVNYRAITPLDVELTITLHIDKVEGRKIWCTGEMTAPDGTLLCDVEALFLVLLPGQP